MPSTPRRTPPAAAGRPASARRPGTGARRPPRPPVRWSTRIAGGLALLVITASGVGHAIVNGLSGSIDRVDAFGGMQGRPDSSKGTNFLLVGTDGRDGLDPSQKRQYHLGGAPCHCTDTIMLVHLSEDRRRASVVSIPRDSYVRLPDVPGRGTSAAAASAAPASTAPASTPPGGTAPAATASALAPASGSGSAAATTAPPAPASTPPAATTAPASPAPAHAHPAVAAVRAVSMASAAPRAAAAPAAGQAAATGAGAAATGQAAAGASAAARPPGTHPAKINEAYADGGPKETVRTVEQLTGVHIDHYIEVDFTSFMKTVDVIGGVKVCTPEPLRDSYTGLDLPAGTTDLDGGQALQYVRSRHIDGSADLGRMQRQQKFLAQVIHKITSGDILTDPMELSKVAGTVLGSVRADQGLRATDLISLAQSMKGFSPGSSEFVSVPLSDTSYDVPGVGSTVKWDGTKAGLLWAAIRADRPLAPPAARTAPDGTVTVAVAPSRISVRVANGTHTNGLAAAAQRALDGAGFVTPGEPTTAATTVARTEIRYDPRWDRSARSLQAALPGARLVQAPGQGAVMRVVLGADYTRVTPVKAAPQPAGDHAVTGDEEVCA